MALVSLTLDNFESLILNDYSEDGYHSLTLEDAKEHPLFEELHKLFKSVKADFNVNNCMSLKVEHNSASAVYAFSAVNKNGKPVLQFGANKADNPQNEVEIEVISKPGEDGEELIVFKAGNATITYDRLDRSKADSKPVFILKFGKAMTSMYVKLCGEDINSNDFDHVENQQDLANLLGSIGTMGVKLTDVVRPYAKQGCKGILPKPLMLEVLSWEIQPTHPEFGTSVLFNITGLEVALKEDKAPGVAGDTVKNPGAIFVNSNQVSAQLIQKPGFAQQALLHKYYGGSLNLMITAVNAKNPERNMPTNVLKNIKPSDPVKADALVKALELAKQGVPFEQILQQVPVPSQHAIAATASVAADIFPQVPEVKVAATMQEYVKAKELVTVGAKASVISAEDEADLEDF